MVSRGEMIDPNNGDKSKEELREEEFKRLLGPLYQDGGMVERRTCPHCGTTNRLAEIVQEYLVFHGRAVPGRRAWTSRSSVIFSDPAAPPPLVGSKVPALIIDRDVCKECGLEYPVRIYRSDITALQVTSNRQAGRGGPQ